MESRIEKLEVLIPKLSGNKKINPLRIEALEWELRALKAERKLKKLLDGTHVIDENPAELPKDN